jgi:hypothetical protein
MIKSALKNRRDANGPERATHPFHARRRSDSGSARAEKAVAEKTGLRGNSATNPTNIWLSKARQPRAVDDVFGQALEPGLDENSRSEPVSTFVTRHDLSL